MPNEISPSERFKEALEGRILSAPGVRKRKLKEIIAENLEYIEEVLKDRRADMRTIAEELGVAYEIEINDRSFATIFYAIRSKKGTKQRAPPVPVAGHIAHFASRPTPSANPGTTGGPVSNQQHRKSVEPIRRDDPDL